jgi:hypothetical protein
MRVDYRSFLDASKGKMRTRKIPLLAQR